MTSNTPAVPEVTTKLRRKRPALSSCRGNHFISANIDPESRSKAHAAVTLAREVFGVNANTSTIYRCGARALAKHLKDVAKKIHALPEGDERRTLMIERERDRLIVANAAGAARDAS
jgi:hypothetical protein